MPILLVAVASLVTGSGAMAETLRRREAQSAAEGPKVAGFGGEKHGLSLVGNPSFSVATLPPEMQKWYRTFWNGVRASRQDIDAAAASNDTYTLGRSVNDYITALMAAMRATGDLQILDEAIRIMEVARGKLKDVHPEGRRQKADGRVSWLWKAGGGAFRNTDRHEMDEAMTHGLVAMFAYALHVNREFRPRYDELARFWLDYMRNHYLKRWGRKGADKRLTHPYSNVMRMHYYMYKLTGDRTHLAQALRRERKLVKMMKLNQKVPEAFMWKHNVSGSDEGWQKINYAHYTLAAIQDMALEEFGAFASNEFMAHLASTFRDVIFVGGKRSMASRVSGEGSRDFYMYNMAGLARWDRTGKLKALAERSGNRRIFNAAYILQALSRRPARPSAIQTASWRPTRRTRPKKKVRRRPLLVRKPHGGKPALPPREDSLAEFRQQLDLVRALVRSGAFDQAAPAVCSILEQTPRDHKDRPALALFALAVADAKHLREKVIQGVAAGRKEQVYVALVGRTSRVRLVGAEPSGLTVEWQGSQMPLTWRELSPAHFAGMARKYLDTDSASDHLALARFCAVRGLAERAGEHANQAAAIDPSLRADIAALTQWLSNSPH